jgi:hypothetical protein
MRYLEKFLFLLSHIFLIYLSDITKELFLNKVSLCQDTLPTGLQAV